MQRRHPNVTAKFRGKDRWEKFVGCSAEKKNLKENKKRGKIGAHGNLRAVKHNRCHYTERVTRSGNRERAVRDAPRLKESAVVEQKGVFCLPSHPLMHGSFFTGVPHHLQGGGGKRYNKGGHKGGGENEQDERKLGHPTAPPWVPVTIVHQRPTVKKRQRRGQKKGGLHERQGRGACKVGVP